MIIRVFNIKMRLELVAVGLGVEPRLLQESKLVKTTMNHTLRGRRPRHSAYSLENTHVQTLTQVVYGYDHPCFQLKDEAETCCSRTWNGYGIGARV